MGWLRKKRKSAELPIASFLENSVVSSALPQSRRGTSSRSHRALNQSLLFGVAIVMTVTGVVASVAITIRGNSSTQDNVISLGVGKAQATSCNNNTSVKTDTISEWDDNLGDFTLQRVDVTGVQSSCQNNAMTLVINMSSGSDLNVTCNLPTTGNLVYTQGTFVFTTTSFSSSGSQYGCPSFSYPLYMASISAAAVQIK
ncbi:hypothetical protein EBT25_09925 [bacterium]|nr:hypothetical protein [bacterium]